MTTFYLFHLCGRVAQENFDIFLFARVKILDCDTEFFMDQF